MSPTRLSNTAAARPAPSGLSAWPISTTKIELSWTDGITNESGWEVHQSTTGPAGTYTLRATLPANVTSHIDSGLVPRTWYCYRVRSFRSAGAKKSFGAFTNDACPTTFGAPAAPSETNAVPRGSSTIEITWRDNAADGQPNVEQGFRVERSVGPAGPWNAVATLGWVFGTQVRSYTDVSGFTGDQETCYRVIAFNAHGESESNVDCTAIPLDATNFVATGVAGPAINLTWTDRSSVEHGYQLRRGGPGNISVVIATLGPNAVSYSDVTVAADTRYTYWLQAMRDGGFSDGVSAEGMSVANAPIAPTSLLARPSGSSAIDVAWTATSDNHNGFRIERSTDGGATWLAIGTLDRFSMAFGDQNATTEVRACYRVFAFNDVGDSAPSSTACTTPPAAPSSLSNPASTSSSIDLSWTDNSSAEDGFEILELFEECSYYYGCYQYWMTVATVGANVTTFRHAGLYPNSVHTYMVIAVKDGGYSNPSDQLTAWTSPGGQ